MTPPPTEDALRAARAAAAWCATQPDARASDPRTLGWMTGSPPPAELRVRFADNTRSRFPQLRWAFSHQRELLPTRAVWRGHGPVAALPRADRDELADVTSTPIGNDRPVTFAQMLDATWTDGIVVLHRGRIVFERYFGALEAHRPHIAMSVTKSFVGTLAATLIAEGALDETRQVAHYVPELKGSAFGDATLRQLLDMRTGLRYSEDYTDPKAEIAEFARSAGLSPRRPDDRAADSTTDYLKTVQKQGAHGEAFAYKTVNTDVMAWVMSRVTGLSLSEQLQTRLWIPLGMEQDGYFSVDSCGTEFAGGGLNASLRDLARFGEMMRCDGAFNGQQIVPAAVVAGVREGGERGGCVKAGFAMLQGWSYRDMWWVTHNAHGAYSARGIHGQAIYVDPAAEMVIARFGSHPGAGSANNDWVSLPAYHAMALALRG